MHQLGRGDLFVGEARTLQADGVDHLGLARVAVSDDERRDVLDALRARRDHGVVTDAAELVDAGVPADIHVVTDMHVPGDGGVAGDDEVVTDHAVMRDVRIGQQHVVVAEDGPFAFLGPAVDADVLAEGIAGADLEAGLARFSLQVLRTAADKGVWEDLALGAELREAFDCRVVVKDATIAVNANFDAVAIPAPAPERPSPKNAAKSAGKPASKRPTKPARKSSDDEDDDDIVDHGPDTIRYEGEHLVLDDVVRDAIVLEIPMMPLCSASCPGIERPPLAEDASDRPIDPRFAALLSVKPGSKA